MIKIIVFTIILLPLIIKGPQKRIAIWISFGLLFLLFGCQYDMTRDWPVYINRWLYATKGWQTQSIELEFIYTLIMRICEPFTYFGYLMICAVFNLWVFKKYLNKYVPLSLVWFALAIFLLRVNFAFTYIDTNRQTLAITFSMLGVYWLINPPKWADTQNKQYSLCAALFLAAVNIHTSAIIALPIIFFPIICKRLKNTKYLWGLMGVFIFSFFVDYNSISNVFNTYMTGNERLSEFSQYTSEIAERSKSIVEQSIYAVLLFLLIYKFSIFNTKEKPIVLAVIIFISLQGYAMYTMARALFYYQVFSIYVIPLLAKKMLVDTNKNKLLTYGFFAVLLAYCVFSFNRDIVHENYKKWANFKTIFTAPKWM